MYWPQNTRWLKTLLLYMVLVVAFLLYGHASFYRDPGSIFFNKSKAYERRYSQYREEEIRSYVADLALGKEGTLPRNKAGPDPKLCASFPSIKRQDIQYLPLSVASSVQGLSDCERADVHVDVFIAHTNITDHPSTHMTWLPNVVDALHGYDVDPEQQKKLGELAAVGDVGEKGVWDYTYALEACFQTRAPWILMFEDDIILADGWLIRTLHAIEDVLSKDTGWLFMRLFNQARTAGWGSTAVGGNHELLISAALSGPVFLLWLILRRKNTTVAKHLDKISIAIICLIAIPTFIVLFFQSGKISMLPPGPGVQIQNFGCCSQGLLFSRERVPQIKEYLLRRKAGQIDVMLDDLANEQHLNRYAIQPILLQHVGAHSSRGAKEDEARAVWSVVYEDQKPSKLQATHESLVQAMYGPS